MGWAYSSLISGPGGGGGGGVEFERFRLRGSGGF